MNDIINYSLCEKFIKNFKDYSKNEINLIGEGLRLSLNEGFEKGKNNTNVLIDIKGKLLNKYYKNNINKFFNEIQLKNIDNGLKSAYVDGHKSGKNIYDFVEISKKTKNKLQIEMANTIRSNSKPENNILIDYITK